MTDAADQAFPEGLKEAVERDLGKRLDTISLLPSGMHDRTFQVGSGTERWVARLNVPKRAILAQERAALAGMRVPCIACCSVELSDEGRFSWVVEEFVEGNGRFAEEQLQGRDKAWDTWLLSIPFRVVGTAMEAFLALVKAILFLPARMLGYTEKT
jgi:hypothetical protein